MNSSSGREAYRARHGWNMLACTKVSRRSCEGRRRDQRVPYRCAVFAIAIEGSLSSDIFISHRDIRFLRPATSCQTSAPPSHADSAAFHCPPDRVAAMDTGRNLRIRRLTWSRLLPFWLLEFAMRDRDLSGRCMNRASGTICMYTLSEMRGKARAVSSRGGFASARRGRSDRRGVDRALGGVALVCR